MILLVKRQDFLDNNRDVSSTVYDTVLNQHIADAQFVDVQKLLGVELYNAILRDSSSYTDLLDGSTYEYQGTTYTNVGLKAVIVFYSYARYLMYGSVKDTPFGFVEKQNSGQSAAADINLKRSLRKNNEEIAFNYWENVQDFLNRNYTDYPLWSQNWAAPNKSRFNIYKVGSRKNRNILTASRFRKY